MNKLKYLLLIVPFLFIINVSAQEIDVTDYCYGTTGYQRMYTGREIQYQTDSNYNFGTTYQFQLSNFLTELRYNFTANTDYVLTFNTNNSDDFRNNFRSYYVQDLDNNNNDLTVSFTYISMKKVQISFRTTTATTKVKVFLGASNVYENITGDTNWNIKNVILTAPDNAPTGSQSNQDVINNATDNTNSIINNQNDNTSNVINNANQNTQEIIDNQNENSEQTNNLLGVCYKNIYNYAKAISLDNLYYIDGGYKQQDSDSLTNPTLKLLFYLGNTLVSVDPYNPVISLSRFKFTFTKTNSFSTITFGVNGTIRDSKVDYDVSYLENGKTYSLIYEVTNIIQGQITLSNVMIVEGNQMVPYVAQGKSHCTSRFDTLGTQVVDGANSIIAAANGNSQDIINNQNQNAQETQDTINNNLNDCQSAGSISFNTISGYELQGNGTITSNNTWLVTDYIKVYPGLNYRFTGFSSRFTCFYNKNKSLVNCNSYSNPITVPNNAYYIRLNSTISNFNGSFIALSDYCENKLDATKNAINDVNNSINNPNVGSGVGSDFFDGFTNQDFGLSQIITIPLNTIQSLTSKSCSPLQVPIPFTNGNISLPCMTEIYQTKFSGVYNIWKTVSFGIVAYLIAIDIFHIVKGFKDPESDKVEVLDL